MREVIGSIMAAVSGLFLLWFLLPMLTTLYNQTKATVDQSDPTIATLLQLGDGVYAILGLIVIVVIGYTIMAYATRREPVDL
jgi:type II secretory pathway component PulF